ncbi:MAG TPA: tetratricopeptide repeat protein [Vicinamibacterales bacterium]|nr:tetratricopeptide repeat protein [Vicinamibacterales bacterium]
MRKVLLAALIVVSACAPKVVPAPVVTSPRFPEFIKPLVPEALIATPAAVYQSRGWAFLQSGDVRTAEHEFSTALKLAPTFYPAETSLGYVELARKDPKAALPHFDRALELAPEHVDVSALVGRGDSLLGVNREADAVTAFSAAVAADPSLTDLGARIEVLKFRSVEQGIARAREAARSGRPDEAVQAYTAAIATSPDSAFLYRELAAVERQKGDPDAALEHLRKAIALEPGDARSLAQVGEILQSRGENEAAEKAYAESLAIEPNAAVERRLEEFRARAALAALPAEYRAIDQAPQVTRADLAALIGIRLAPLLQGGRRAGDAALITDVRANWAATWIMQVARAGVMDPYANHAFQPRALVRRADLAQAAGRLLERVAAQNPAQGRGWNAARLKFSDLAPSHLAYPAASMAVAAGVMQTGENNSFQPSKPVTGADAVDAIAKIEALAASR